MIPRPLQHRTAIESTPSTRYNKIFLTAFLLLGLQSCDSASLIGGITNPLSIWRGFNGKKIEQIQEVYPLNFTQYFIDPASIDSNNAEGSFLNAITSQTIGVDKENNSLNVTHSQIVILSKSDQTIVIDGGLFTIWNAQFDGELSNTLVDYDKVKLIVVSGDASGRVRLFYRVINGQILIFTAQGSDISHLAIHIQNRID